MPEYLAPGVYMEEIEIGAKPIEGVSTSTAGFLGYSERGPLNKPTLVTSFADFQRTFGGFLPVGNDLNKIRWLAYAVSAFFENGGKRAFITRVANDDADVASGTIPRLSDVGESPVTLGTDAEKGETAIKISPELPAGWNMDCVLFLKDGIKSEYLQYKGGTKKIEINTETKDIKKVSTAGALVTVVVIPETETTTLTSQAAKGGMEIIVSAAASITPDDLLILEQETHKEVVTVESKDNKTLSLKQKLLEDYDQGARVYKLEKGEKTTLLTHVKPDSTKFYVSVEADVQANDTVTIEGSVIPITAVGSEPEMIQVSGALKYSHSIDDDPQSAIDIIKLEPAIRIAAASPGTWGDQVKVSVQPKSICSTRLAAPAENTNQLQLEMVTGIESGSVLRLTSNAATQYILVDEVHKTDSGNFVLLLDNITGSFEKGDLVQTEEFDLIATTPDQEEIFKDLSLNPNHSRFIKQIVTEKSSALIRTGEILSESTDIIMPTPENLPGWKLSGGNDGILSNPSDEDLNVIYEGEDHTEPNLRTGLYTFKNVDEINIVSIPGMTSSYLQQKLVIHCETSMKDRFAVLDSMEKADLDEIRAQRNVFDSSYAAIYYPWVYSFDPVSKEYINMPPSGYVCGVYARCDVERGVHKAPANEKLNGVANIERLNGRFRIVNKGTQEILNPLGINCIRPFPGRGIRVWGARTLTSNSLWKYVNVRRLFLFLEESIEKGTQWVVFEPNDEKLWARVKQTINQFLTRVWKDGALMGSTPEEAFFIKCDRTTMTQDDIDNGRLILLIGVAPVKPAEFVIFRIAQWQGGSAATE